MAAPVRRNSDRRIRDLERRWQESGSPEDRAAWLMAAARAGDEHSAQLLQADEEVAFTLGERTMPPILFPEARRWRDLFASMEDVAPLSGERILRNPGHR